jgi:creatinine amidohydrolase
MQWENLTSAEFAAAAKKTGVCIVSMGVIEKHGEHLPLGTDFLNGHRSACMAAEREPAVVFPPFYFGQIYEARCFPGTVTLEPTLLLKVIWGVFDEIGRNGFRKILVWNAHGGNWHLLQFLAQCALWVEKPYSVYVALRNYMPDPKKHAEICETKEHGHACECETSISLANHPHLVRLGAIPKKPATALKRAAHLPDLYTGIHWYADYPVHYAGDARPASAEKGRALQELQVENCARMIRAVKGDRAVPMLTREFFRRVESLRAK